MLNLSFYPTSLYPSSHKDDKSDGRCKSRNQRKVFQWLGRRIWQVGQEEKHDEEKSDQEGNPQKDGREEDGREEDGC